eukprot:4261518-Lingulodinium_polyedra.AAC.1
MMRSNRLSATATPHKSHASNSPREHQKMAFAWSAWACDLRAAATADGRFDRIIAHGFKKPCATMR